MVDDSEARRAVRLLMERFETIAEQRNALAYVLAKRDRNEYARLLEAAEKMIPAVIQPLIDRDVQRSQMYAALDDANADWPKAVLSMLNQDTIILSADQAMEDILRLEDPEWPDVQ
jgi:hypothetical protein